jgi:hypothetical protein
LKKHRLITAAALCAVGITGVSASSASALYQAPPPAKVQLFDAGGLARTIDCTTSDDALCAGGDAGFHALEVAMRTNTPGPYSFISAGRWVAPNDIVYFGAFANDASLALVERLEAAGQTDGAHSVLNQADSDAINAWLKSFDQPGAAQSAKAAKKHAKSAKHGKRAKHAKR